jgi:hypothetical protein
LTVRAENPVFPAFSLHKVRMKLHIDWEFAEFHEAAEPATARRMEQM